MLHEVLLLIYVNHNWGSDWESAWDSESVIDFSTGFDCTSNYLSFLVNLCCSVYFAWWDKDHSVPWWDVFPGALLFFTCAVITLHFSSLMLISAAALAVPWRQSHCNTALMCPWVLRVPVRQGVRGWLWLPLIYIKTPPVICLWRDDMALCTLLILLISYGPSSLIPSCCSEFSVLLFTFCPTDNFEASFSVCLAFLSPFLPVVSILGNVDITFCLTPWSLMAFFSAHVAVDRQPVLCGAQWVLWMCIQLNKDHQLSLPRQLGGRLQDQDLCQGGSLM